MNVKGRDNVTNELYGTLPLITFKIQSRRMKLAGHCIRHEEEIANKLVLWEPLDGTRSRGVQPKSRGLDFWNPEIEQSRKNSSCLN